MKNGDYVVRVGSRVRIPSLNMVGVVERDRFNGMVDVRSKENGYLISCLYKDEVVKIGK